MRIGAIFPQTEIGPDPGAARAFAQAAEDLGYDYLLAFDHVLGANPAGRQGWTGPYDHTHMFHEPFVLYGYLAGLTKTIEFTTGIIILPQRQTVLVAKQASAVDVLSGGRFRLGVGVGWNEPEFEALGENFHNRGRRSEEQIEVLRKLFAEELVTFEGKWHRITDAGLNPMPVQRPIPIWMGGGSAESVRTSTDADKATRRGGNEPVMRRIARLGDGWFPQFTATEEGRDQIEQMRGYIREAGRDPEAFGIDGRISLAERTGEDEWAEDFRRWREYGATHVGLGTMNVGLTGPDAHIDAIRRLKAAVDGA
ncbi:MAG TPA: LLM class F420-dependent oxidoreductase [Rhodospirillales bacterium]|jgi:probable F420-dependent oxidoreductase|nr:LLM class F420-dependent oxidoreductase [Rhodospirillales bacterium]HJO69561.1 LLM class F420-dependent oxidoreductase [Rhodospirillales bacterium]